MIYVQKIKGDIMEYLDGKNEALGFSSFQVELQYFVLMYNRDELNHGILFQCIELRYSVLIYKRIMERKYQNQEELEGQHNLTKKLISYTNLGGWAIEVNFTVTCSFYFY